MPERLVISTKGQSDLTNITKNASMCLCECENTVKSARQTWNGIAGVNKQAASKHVVFDTDICGTSLYTSMIYYSLFGFVVLW